MNPDIALPTEPSYLELAECRIPGEISMIGSVMERMRVYFQARGIRKDQFAPLESAVQEAINNAVFHGCKGHAAPTVSCRWHWTDETACVEIIDPGNFLPPPGQPSLPRDPLSENGRGLYLMGHYSDAVQHELTPSGHLVRMTKKVGPPAWHVGEAASMEETIEAMAEELSRSYEEISALFGFAEGLATASGIAEILDRTLDRLLELVPGEQVFVRFQDPETNCLARACPENGAMEGIPERLSTDAPSTEALAYWDRKVITVADCSKLPEADPLRKFPAAALVCPVFFQTEVLGVLVVTQRRGAASFSAGEMALIRFVADGLGIAHASSRVQEQRQAQQRSLRELEIAASIQNSLLPREFPPFGNYRIAGRCQSARQVGGDYFDVLPAGDGGLLLVIADVMGKGIPAALVATILRTAIRARSDLASQPGRLLAEVNRQIAPDLVPMEMFITAQVAFLSASDHSLTLANAGHCPLYRFGRADGTVTPFHGEGVPIGIFDRYDYEAQRHEIGRGDLLVFLTDGVYEVENADGEMLGVERLVDCVKKLWGEGASNFCDAIHDFVREYTGDQIALDDRTLVTVQRTE